MWSCKRCETMNEESNSVCSLCGTLRTTPDSAAKQAKAEPQMGANYRYAQSAGQSAPRTGREEKAGKAGGFKILAAVLFVFLAVAVGAIVFLVNRAPAPSGELAQATQQDMAQTSADAGKDGNSTGGADLSAPATQTVCGDVTLTVESHCQYLANIIPTENPLEMTNMPMDGITYQADTVQFFVGECSLVNFLGTAMGHQPVEGAAVQLSCLDTGETWDVTSGADGGCAAIPSLSPGIYMYSIIRDGYEAYTSNHFYLEQPSNSSAEPAIIGGYLVPVGSVFSNGFMIQLTDADGNPIEDKPFGGILLYTCDQEGSQYFIRGGIYIGEQTNGQGMVTTPYNPDSPSLSSLREGTIAMIVIDGVAVWGESGVTDQYIIIRAE